MTLGKVVEQLREEAGLTQTELAVEMQRRLGRGSGNASSISMMESGKALPRIDMLMELADYFCVSVDFLLERTETPQPYPPGKSLIFPVASSEQAAVVKEFVDFIMGLPPDAARAMLEGQKGFWQALRQGSGE